MVARVAAAVSILVTAIVAIILVAYMTSSVVGAHLAQTLDHTWPGPGLGGNFCRPDQIHPALYAPRSIQQDESAVVTLVVDVDPPSEGESAGASPTPTECMLNIELLAPKFELTPAVSSVTASVVRGQSYVGRWLFAPKDMGTYRLAFTVNTCFGVIGVAVLNPFGLPAKLALGLALFSSAFVAWITKSLAWVAERAKVRLHELVDWLKRRRKPHLAPPAPGDTEPGWLPPA